MAKKTAYAVLCDLSIAGVAFKGGSIVLLDEKDAKPYAGSIDSSKAQVEQFAAQFDSKPIDVEAVAPST
jgi:hypothetical protein